MKSPARAVLLCLTLTSLCAAPPQYYVTGQVGVFNADAGSSAAFGPYVDRGIRSGSKTLVDFAVGADFLDWLSLEAGYVDFASFSSAVFIVSPDVATARAEAIWQTYELRAYRLTPVFHVSLADHLTLSVLGGLTHSTGQVAVQDRTLPRYKSTLDLNNDSYHYGFGFTYRLTGHAALEARYLHCDFGKATHATNRVTANTASLGLSWHF